MHPDPESNNSLFHARKSWAIASLTAVLLAGFEIFLACTNLGHYDDLYDAGNYLESARMMIRGGHLYSTIFDSQPPLWLPLVYGSLRLFGMNFLGGQMLIVATGVLVVLMVGLVTRELSDWPGAWIAAAIVILSPLELQWSRTVSPEVPASAFAVAGMAFAMRYARSGARGPLLMASGLVACSVLVKLLGLFTLPALVLAIAVRHWRVSRAAPPIKLRPLTEDTLIVLGTFAAVIIIALAPFGPALVWKQAVEFHWAARSAIAADLMPQATTVMRQFFAGDWLLTAASMFGVIGVLSAPEGIVIAGWIAFTIAGLFYHHPLFSHHMVVLIPPLAIAAGAGWSGFWRWLVRMMRSSQPAHNGIRSITAGLSITAAISLGAGLSTLAARQASAQMRSIQQVRPDDADLKAAQLIEQLTAADASILTDAQGIAFLAGRDVPPQLTDTSLVRIASGYLTTAEVIGAAERSDVRLFLSWSGRLTLLPGVTQWAVRRFPFHVTMGKGRELYSMRPPSGSLPASD